MLDEASAALATTAAKALIAAMTSDTWVSFKKAFARLLGRGQPNESKTAEKQLEREQSRLTMAPMAERERLSAEFELAFQKWFVDLLREEPRSTDQMRTLVGQVSAVLPAVTWAPLTPGLLT
jgi:hypothetical protein